MANTEPFLFFWKRVETKERKLLSVALGTYFKHHLLKFTGPARQDSALIELKEKLWWPKVGSNWGPDADSQKGIQLGFTELPAQAGAPSKTLADDWACKLGCRCKCKRSTTPMVDGAPTKDGNPRPSTCGIRSGATAIPEERMKTIWKLRGLAERVERKDSMSQLNNTKIISIEVQ